MAGYDRGKVYVDGVERRDVTICDTAEGWADYFLRDENGKLVVVDGNSIAKRRVAGRVEFVPD
jgi:hypothetical protein